MLCFIVPSHRELALAGAYVVLACRRIDAGKKLMQEWKSNAPDITAEVSRHCHAPTVTCGIQNVRLLHENASPFQCTQIAYSR